MAQGLMDLASKKPMATDTIFHLASMTKPIVGAAILMLMEEGKLRLTDPISKYIPELKTLTVAVPMEAGRGQTAGRGAEPRFYTVPAAREITTKDLLTHTSGLVSGGISATEAAKMPRKPTDSLADWHEEIVFEGCGGRLAHHGQRVGKRQGREVQTAASWTATGSTCRTDRDLMV